MATPQHKNPCTGGHDIKKFGRPFLSHHYCIVLLTFSDPCHSVKKKRRNIAFSLYGHAPAREPMSRVL